MNVPCIAGSASTPASTHPEASSACALPVSGSTPTASSAKTFTTTDRRARGTSERKVIVIDNYVNDPSWRPRERFWQVSTGSSFVEERYLVFNRGEKSSTMQCDQIFRAGLFKAQLVWSSNSSPRFLSQLHEFEQKLTRAFRPGFKCRNEAVLVENVPHIHDQIGRKA